MHCIELKSEQNRTYHYPDGSSFTIETPRHLTVLESGSHRIISCDGRTYRPERGWIAISWLPKTGEPAWVA